MSLTMSGSQPRYVAQVMQSKTGYSDQTRRTNDASTLRKFCSGSHNVQAAAIYDLAVQITQIKDSFMPQAQAKNIDLSLAIDREIPVAYWDMSSLRDEVLNVLLGKAISHTPAGGKIALSMHELDNYTMSIKISCSTANVNPGNNFALCGHDLNGALLCVLAHQGTMDLVQETEQSGATFEIKLPLYALCMT